MQESKLDTININGMVIVFETSASNGLGNMELLHNTISNKYNCKQTLETAFLWHEQKPMRFMEQRCPGGAYERALLERKKQEQKQKIINEILAEQAQAAAEKKRKFETKLEAEVEQIRENRGHSKAKLIQDTMSKPCRPLKRRRLKENIAVDFDISFQPTTHLAI